MNDGSDNRTGSYRNACMILFFFMLSCNTPHAARENVEVLWEEGRAAGLSIASAHLDNVPDDALRSRLTVHFGAAAQPLPMLGEFRRNNDRLIFRPLIPFAHGSDYHVKLDGNEIATVRIPVAEETPELLAIYPSADTLPDNVLKFYFQFSAPMQEGRSLRQIVLVKNNRDTVKNVFLDLQPELWSQDGTWFTLWLDPGRIKRDLQPNKRFGPPLENGCTYRLIVDGRWQSAQGTGLKQQYSKNFVVSIADSISPSPKKWKVAAPKSGTKDPLQIDLRESMDRILVAEAIRVVSDNNDIVDGHISLEKNESLLRFTPTRPWARSTYRLQIDLRLEDLAGNNLVRVFDRDVTRTPPPKEEIPHRLTFTIN